MKKITLVLIVLLLPWYSFSQDTVGLVAHWKMNGNALDATGHGHNGTLHNVTPVLGKAGVGDTAFYFTGRTDTPSFISIPYSPDLNVTKYSICATVKVSGFYTGLCQANTILSRGSYTLSPSSGNYQLYFWDHNDCYTADTTTNIFSILASNNNAGISGSLWGYTPAIVENVWYSVVGTWDSTTFRVYVDGKLKVTVAPTTPVPIGSSTDSLVIGYDTWELPTYPYPFKGVIDDIRLYNRVLDSNEVITYDTTSLGGQSPADTSDTSAFIPIYNNNVSMYIFPNPAHSNIGIQIRDNNLKCSVKLLNELGQFISEKQINNSATDFDLTGLPVGMYILKLQFTGQTVYRKFIKE